MPIFSVHLTRHTELEQWVEVEAANAESAAERAQEEADWNEFLRSYDTVVVGDIELVDEASPSL